MGLILGTPMEIVNTVDEVRITSILNNVETEYVVIHYKLIIGGVVPVGTQVVAIQGKEAIKALYAEQDAVMATGKTFEEASREILYNKVLESINTK